MFPIKDEYEITKELSSEELSSYIESRIAHHGKNPPSDEKAEVEKKTEASKHNYSNLHQRATFFCVPIPGESDWVKNVITFAMFFHYSGK